MYSIYHANILSYSVVTTSAFFISSSATYRALHTDSKTNQNCSGSYDPRPLKLGILASLAMLLGGGGGGGGVGVGNI